MQSLLVLTGALLQHVGRLQEGGSSYREQSLPEEAKLSFCRRQEETHRFLCILL